MAKCDVAIIGAGPYGLSATAHLRTVKGLDVHTFGEPMSFWERNMPKGMLLRSGWAASQIADPNQSLTMEAYQAASRTHFSSPVPLDHFVEYGHWYQRQSVPGLDSRKIARVEPDSKGFRLMLQDGETVLAGRLVVAAGIGSFTWRPPEFASLPCSLASHTSEHRELRRFAGKQVLVIGSGQSALESAALLHESGTEVEIVARARQIRWLGGLVSRTMQHGLGTISKLLYAPTDVGPAGISQVVARPDFVRRMPRSIQDWLRNRSIRPAGAGWLVARLQNVPINLGRSIVSAAPVGERIRVQLNDGSDVPAELLAEAVLEIVHHFGAASYETQKVEGHWRHGGVLIRDNLVKLVVDAPDVVTNRRWMKEYKERWRSRLDQVELWMVSYAVEVE